MVRQRNFMSMSDDEDEEAKNENPGGDTNVVDDGDAPERPHPTTSMSSFVLSPPLPSPSRRADMVSRERDRLPINEEENRVLPLLASNFCPHVQRTSSSSSMSKPKLRHDTPGSFFFSLFALFFAIPTLCRASRCARILSLAAKRANLLSPSRDLILSTRTHSRRSEAFRR